MAEEVDGNERTEIAVGLEVLVDGEFEPENPLSDDHIVYDEDEEFTREYAKLFGGKFLINYLFFIFILLAIIVSIVLR